MKKYSDMTKEELLTLKAQLEKEFADIKAQGLTLDMSRGKPWQRTAGSFHGNDERIKQRFKSEM